ncbi:TolC family protein [Kamptonema cortianum]|nr:TolC family protein [Geitlerinema splendidum]MDK3160354.1 TolC family protein [Kamptonema cortianum]
MKWRAITALAWLSVACVAFSQETLTLEKSLLLAKEGNGQVQAALLNYAAAVASTRANRSSFLPTLTPTASREFSRSENFTGPLKGNFDTSGTAAFIDFNWRLLDNGQRQVAYDLARSNQQSQEYAALDTLRAVLFDVHSRFYDALRAQELLRVRDDDLKRAKEILDQTIIRANPPIEDVPRKDVLQAKADYENARVNKLVAENRIATSHADLKAVLAWDQPELPVLVGPEVAQQPALEVTLESAIATGLAQRPDLLSSRQRITGQRSSLRLAKIEGGIQYSVDANYRRSFLEDHSQRSALVFTASIPLYDGDRTRQATLVEELTLQSLEHSLEQSERQARAEIESAYKEYTQNRIRFEAATAALEAAKMNYEAAIASRQEGVGTLIEVLTAQVSLTTAESNIVEATFDLMISDVRLKLVTGQPLPGE